MTIPDSDLDAIEARAKAATGGVWEFGEEDFILVDGVADIAAICRDNRYANADFISHAGGDNGDVIRLVAEVRRLLAELEKRG